MIKRDLYYERIPTKSLKRGCKVSRKYTLGNVIKEQEGSNISIILLRKLENLSKANRVNIKQQDSYKKISSEHKVRINPK